MKHVLKFREVDRDKFEALKSGEKSIETRAATSKFKNIRPGDTLIVMCGSDNYEKVVKEATIYASLDRLFNNYSYKEILPTSSSLSEAIAVIEGFPGYPEKIRKHGIIALRV